MLQDSYTFTLNENLAFHPDYPIKEILGIGLEPVLSIQEMGETLSIRGAMELKGEYIPSEERVEEEKVNGQDVERIEVMSDDICEFFHKFVMDITIPMDRVHELDSVTVDVDHFDYAIHSARSLNIEAVLAIKGLSQEADEVITSEEPELLTRFESEEETREKASEEEDSFQFTVNEELEPENSNSEPDNVVPLINEETSTDDDQLTEQREDEEQEEIMEEPAEERDEDSFIDETESDDPVDVEETVEEGTEDRLRVQARAETDDTSYLLNIFTEEEEMAYTRLKLYIVQPTDQLTSIAEKYNVTPRQIMRTNQLEDEDLSSGQLIYIPVTADE
ncbi:stage VI sporulation protein D [Gracilibacillus ureilyticus]|uniref:stage VI sporulation protein D n=1 Tax=Gracilibacillus ureilyticus TaxID=531814 RepID=UPI001587892E|nr:stage VI sporulation protein D [Gracilibacillus ureilyticus]